mgnify:CR=1 FL=1
MSDRPWFLVLRNTPEQQAIFNWWVGLEQRKGERAALRRCDSAESAMKEIGSLRLQFTLQKLALKVSEEAITNVAYVLAHLKPSDELLKQESEQRFALLMQTYKTRLAVQMGSEREGGAEKPLISELRFQRLLQTSTQQNDDFSIDLRRIVRHLDKEVKVNPVLVADDIFYRFRALKKPDEYRGEKSFQFKLAKDYYQEVFTYQKDEQGA